MTQETWYQGEKELGFFPEGSLRSQMVPLKFILWLCQMLGKWERSLFMKKNILLKHAEISLDVDAASFFLCLWPAFPVVVVGKNL